MRSYVPQFDLINADNLAHALELLDQQRKFLRPMAGGTDLMVLFEAGLLPPGRFLNLWNLDELRSIDVADDYVEMGALVTYSQLIEHEIINSEFPNLVQAAKETGAVATQNRGTLGGNIANASPAADSPPALLVYDAEIMVISKKGIRSLPYHSFHTGYKQTQLRPEELIYKIRIPLAKKRCGHYFKKVGTRRMQAISKVVFAGMVQLEKSCINELRIALGSIAPTALRCYKTEMLLKSQSVPLAKQLVADAKVMLHDEIKPIDDVRSTAEYRMTVSANLLEDFLGGL